MGRQEVDARHSGDDALAARFDALHSVRFSLLRSSKSTAFDAGHSSFSAPWTRISTWCPPRTCSMRLNLCGRACLAVHFRQYCPEPNPYALNRYDFEAERHWKIIDVRLSQSRYMLGETHTIVDMAVWGRARLIVSCEKRSTVILVPSGERLTVPRSRAKLLRADSFSVAAAAAQDMAVGRPHIGTARCLGHELRASCQVRAFPHRAHQRNRREGADQQQHTTDLAPLYGTEPAGRQQADAGPEQASRTGDGAEYRQGNICVSHLCLRIHGGGLGLVRLWSAPLAQCVVPPIGITPCRDAS